MHDMKKSMADIEIADIEMSQLPTSRNLPPRLSFVHPDDSHFASRRMSGNNQQFARSGSIISNSEKEPPRRTALHLTLAEIFDLRGFTNGTLWKQAFIEAWGQ